MSDCQECDRLQRAWDKAETDANQIADLVRQQDAEIATLRAERDEARRERDDWERTASNYDTARLAAVDWQCRYQRQADALRADLGRWIEIAAGFQRQLATAEARARTAEAERDALREQIETALARLQKRQGSKAHRDWGTLGPCLCIFCELITALRSPTPALDGGTE